MSAEGRRGLEESGRGRGFHRLERVCRVDGSVGPLCSLCRVEDLGARPGVDAVALYARGAERGEHLARWRDRLDVSVGGIEQVAVRFLSDIAIVDQGEGARHRPVGGVEDHARRRVLDQADHELEAASSTDREQAGGISGLRVHRPEQHAGGRELVDELAVVGREVDVAGWVDHRGGRRVVRELGGQGKRGRLGPGQRVGHQLGAGIHVEGRGGGGEVLDPSAGHDHGRGRVGREARGRPQDRCRSRRVAHGGDLGSGGSCRAPGELRCRSTQSRSGPERHYEGQRHHECRCDHRRQGVSGRHSARFPRLV